MENNRFWDKIFPKHLWIANTLKNYASKPWSTYKNVPLYQISINMENIRLCPSLPKIKRMTKFWKTKHWNHNKHVTMYTCTKFQLIWRTSDLGTKFAQKYQWQKFWKNKHQSRNKHIAIYLCTKFQSIWRTSDFGTKFAQKLWMKKTLKKKTIKL